MKKWLIISVIAALIITMFIIYVFFFWGRPPGPIVNCEPASGFGNQEDTLACYNNIYVNKVAPCPYGTDSDLLKCDEIYIYNAESGAEIIHKVEAYALNDHFIYAIGSLSYFEARDEAGNISLLTPYQIKGGREILELDSPNDLHRYFTVDAITNDFTIYKTPDEMTQETRKIFEDLESN